MRFDILVLLPQEAASANGVTPKAPAIAAFLERQGVKAATTHATSILSRASALNQPRTDVVEISSTRLLVAALEIARQESARVDELTGLMALDRLVTADSRFAAIRAVEAEFLSAKGRAIDDGAFIDATTNVSEILAHTSVLDDHFGKTDTLGADSLLVALLRQPGTKLEERLKARGIALASLRSALLETIRVSDPERHDLWTSAFALSLELTAGPTAPTAEPPRSNGGIVYARLGDDSPDRTSVDDKLDVGDEARAFARVAAARQVVPPLAFGIFGDWGSGKSFFMRLIYEHVEAIAASAARDPVDEASFHQRIVQIRFNAWHYVESNLWASLVDYIFVELDRWLRVKAGDPAQNTLLDKLATARELTLDSAQRLVAQRQQQKLASERLAAAERELAVQRVRTATTPRLFWNVVRDTFVAAMADDKELKSAAAKLGFDQLADDGEALKDALDSLSTEARRGQIVAKGARDRLLAGPFIGLALAAIIVVPIVVGWAGHWIVSFGGGLVGEAHLIILQASAAIAAIATFVRMTTSQVKNAAAVLDRYRDKRGGSVCLNSYWGFAKWISALVMPLPGLASAR